MDNFYCSLPFYVLPVGASLALLDNRNTPTEGKAIGAGILATLALSNMFGFFRVLGDKLTAKGYHYDDWRTPEFYLIWPSWFGGAPGTFLAMTLFNHKTSDMKNELREKIWEAVEFHGFLQVGLVGLLLAAWNSSKYLAS